MSRGFVYFARPQIGKENAPVKIGWSKNPWATVNEGQRWTWYPMAVEAIVEIELSHRLAGTRYSGLERLLHDALNGQRIAREWFAFIGPTVELFNMVIHEASALEIEEWAILRLSHVDRKIRLEFA